MLYPLPVPDRPWQHIAMDFKLFAKAKDSYNAGFIIIDQLSKQSVLIPCYKTIIAKEMA
jgi:hypothetical protein